MVVKEEEESVAESVKGGKREIEINSWFTGMS